MDERFSTRQHRLTRRSRLARYRLPKIISISFAYFFSPWPRAINLSIVPRDPPPPRRRLHASLSRPVKHNNCLCRLSALSFLSRSLCRRHRTDATAQQEVWFKTWKNTHAHTFYPSPEDKQQTDRDRYVMFRGVRRRETDTREFYPSAGRVIDRAESGGGGRALLSRRPTGICLSLSVTYACIYQCVFFLRFIVIHFDAYVSPRSRSHPSSRPRGS